jgi:hypothetical protein
MGTPNKIGNLQTCSDPCCLHSSQMVALFDALQSLAVIARSLCVQYTYRVVLLQYSTHTVHIPRSVITVQYTYRVVLLQYSTHTA